MTAIPLIAVVRHVRARQATDDPAALIAEAEGVFRDVRSFARDNKHDLARNAATLLGDLCLRLCVASSHSSRGAENKRRFLAIMERWAWPRDPALGAVLGAARRVEGQTWKRKAEAGAP